MLQLGLVVIGVDDLPRATAFWSAALGYCLADHQATERWQELWPPPGVPGHPIALQVSETPTQDHPRLHIDLNVASLAEREAEARRLEALGATRVDWDMLPDDPDFIVMADTEGNRFYLVDSSHP
jgi:catechol 2,3-dioxygenase-like lactoylglutathione lyase family enzyme